MGEFLYESTGFSKDQRVKMLAKTMGDDHLGAEHILPAGQIGVVFSIERKELPKGLTFTIWIPVDETQDRGIVNVFDESDGPITNFIEGVDHAA